MKVGKVAPLLTCIAAVQGQDNISLDHTKWELMRPADGELPSGSKITVTFEDGHFSISACNLIGGAFRLEGETLIVPNALRSTRKACLNGLEKWDEALSAVFTGRPRVNVLSDQLTLTTQDGSRWEFTREPYSSKNAQTRFIYVAALTKDCTGVAPMKCLQIRESKDEPWKLSYIPIQGFEHIPGIEYRLRIKEDKNPNPAADSPSVTWYLDMAVEQTVVDRKAAEDYEKQKRER
jgi:heat shock protein HslJ